MDGIPLSVWAVFNGTTCIFISRIMEGLGSGDRFGSISLSCNIRSSYYLASTSYYFMSTSLLRIWIFFWRFAHLYLRMCFIEFLFRVVFRFIRWGYNVFYAWNSDFGNVSRLLLVHVSTSTILISDSCPTWGLLSERLIPNFSEGRCVVTVYAV